jgi:hypothetical protein
VKDIKPEENVWLGFQQVDLYPRIREKIGAGRKKFKEFKEYCCALVLYSAEPERIGLLEENTMLGAMYGNSGFACLVNNSTGAREVSHIQPAFLRGGKMLRPGRPTPENTTISAIITLTEIRPHYERLLDMMDEYPAMNVAELQGQAERVIPDFAPNRGLPRVIVWHNAVARIGFPENLFRGPYDTHLGTVREGDELSQRVTYRGHLLPERVRI